MKILITGGSGFIGSHLAELLLKKGDEVFVIDNLSTGKLKNIEHMKENPKFHYKIDSILNEDVLEDYVKQVEQIYHLAAAVGVKYIIDNPLLSLQTNIRGTENVLRLANKYKVKILIVSTSEIYGKSDKIPFKETDDRVLGSTHISRWGYSTSKAVDEFLGLAYYREKKLPVIIVRCFNTVGPRQTGQYGMVIPKFVKNALLGHPITVFGDGKQTRCFTDVEDVVDAMVKLMKTEKAVGQIFNLGNDDEIEIIALAEKVKKMTKSKSKIEFVKYEDAFETGFEDMRRRFPDLSKIRKFIGYNPKYKLNDILERVIEFYES